MHSSNSSGRGKPSRQGWFVGWPSALLQRGPVCEADINETHLERVHYDDLVNITSTERLSASANSSRPVGYAERRNMVFPKVPRRFDSLVMKTLGKRSQ
jgi:hypothetical protein